MCRASEDFINLIVVARPETRHAPRCLAVSVSVSAEKLSTQHFPNFPLFVFFSVVFCIFILFSFVVFLELISLAEL